MVDAPKTSNFRAKRLSDTRLQEAINFAWMRNESTHWDGCEQAHVYCAIEMALTELKELRTAETAQRKVEAEKPGVFDWLECPVTKEPCDCKVFCKRMRDPEAGVDK